MIGTSEIATPECGVHMLWEAEVRPGWLQAKRADAEERGRFNRKRRELARTPHPMLLTRISQLVASFEDLQRDMDVLRAMLDGDQNSSSTRRKLGAAQTLCCMQLQMPCVFHPQS